MKIKYYTRPQLGLFNKNSVGRVVHETLTRYYFFAENGQKHVYEK